MLGGWGHLRPITCNETWSHIFKYERMSNVILIYIYRVRCGIGAYCIVLKVTYRVSFSEREVMKPYRARYGRRG